MICDFVATAVLSFVIFAINILMKLTISVLFSLSKCLSYLGYRKNWYFDIRFVLLRNVYFHDLFQMNRFTQISNFPRSFTVEINIVKLESSLNYAHILKPKSSWTGVTLESLTRESDRMILMFMWLLEQLQAEYRNNCDCSESNSCNILLAAPGGGGGSLRSPRTPRRLCISVFCE